MVDIIIRILMWNQKTFSIYHKFRLSTDYYTHFKYRKCMSTVLSKYIYTVE